MNYVSFTTIHSSSTLDTIYIVHNFNVRVKDVKLIDTLFGGGNGYSVVWNSNIKVEGETEINYLVAGGSNGYTNKSRIVMNGGHAKIMQGVNRGILNRAELILNSGVVDNFYAAGENDPVAITGVQYEAYIELNGGEVANFFKGISGTEEFTGLIEGHIMDCVVAEGDVSMLEKVENHIHEPKFKLSFNENGELVVIIGDVTKIFVPKDVLKESPKADDVQVDTLTFNNELLNLIQEFSNLELQDGYIDADLSDTYMTVATIDDPEYAATEKQVTLNGVELAKTSKLSIGNGNFIEFDQIIDNGTDIQLSMFTLAVAGDSALTISADGYDDMEIKVSLENSTEVDKVQMIKGANWQNEKYNINEIAENEYEIEILEPLNPASWAPDLNGGVVWLLFEYIVNGENILTENEQMIYMEIRDGENVSSGVDVIKQFTAEDGSKDYREFMYINVYNDHAYELEYIFALSDGNCKPQKVLIHVPVNVPKE